MELFWYQEELKQKPARESFFEKLSQVSLGAILPYFFFSAAMFLFGNVFTPIAKWEFFDKREILAERSVLSPLAETSYRSSPAGFSPKRVIGGDSLASGFVLGAAKTAAKKAEPKAFTVSVPKLGILEATVKINGEEKDLKKMLIHLKGTGLPGDFGNAVVTGHSALPQFFNPKNYETIFSTLYKLRFGDEIFAEIEGVKYRYVVDSMQVVSPNETSVFHQPADSYFLTLITCVPPGLDFERLIVRARLEKP